MHPSGEQREIQYNPDRNEHTANGQSALVLHQVTFDEAVDDPPEKKDGQADGHYYSSHGPNLWNG